jgi:hypothetical protein
MIYGLVAHFGEVETADSSGGRNTSITEVWSDGTQQAAEGDVADAGEDLFAGPAAGVAAGAGSAVLGKDRRGPL